MKNKLLVAIPTMNRATEITLLAQSLRTQTFQDWDLIVVDGSFRPDGNPEDVRIHYFASKVLNQILLEDHYVEFQREENKGLEECRNQCIRYARTNEYTHILFIDDDSILDKDYIELLWKEIKREKFGAIGGIVPPIAYPNIKRSTKHVKPIFNEFKCTKDGDPICAKCNKHFVPLPGAPLVCTNCRNSYVASNAMYDYIESEVIDTDHIQSGFLADLKALEKAGDFVEDKTFPAFREDTETSMRIKMAGYWIGVHTGAKAWHMQTPTGGCRADGQKYGSDVKIDDDNFRIKVKRWCLKGKWGNIEDEPKKMG